MRDGAAGQSTRTAVVDRAVAEAMALQGWIAAEVAGRITRYSITPAGRAALADMLPDVERRSGPAGFAEAQTTYGVLGVKVWIFKGEVFGDQQPEEPAPKAAGKKG